MCSLAYSLASVYCRICRMPDISDVHQLVAVHAVSFLVSQRSPLPAVRSFALRAVLAGSRALPVPPRSLHRHTGVWEAGSQISR